MKKAFLATAAAAALLSFAQPAAADPASNYQIDAAHDGQVRFTKDFHAPLKQRWIKDLGGTTTYPVYGDGLVFVSAAADTGTEVYALKAKNGDVAWHVTVQGGGAPAYDNGRVFVLGSGGFLQAFDAKTGASLWGKQETGEFFFDDPVTASNGKVYFDGTESGVVIYAVNETDGSLAWTQGGPAGDTNLAVGGGNIYASFPCDDSAFKAKKGKFQWAFTQGCDGGGESVPVYFEGRVYIDDNVDRVVLDAKTGAELHPFLDDTYAPAFWEPTSGSSMGFVVTVNGTLTAFDAASGTTAWSISPSGLSCPPIVLNDTVFVGDTSGNLTALDPMTGNQIWTTNLGAMIGDGSEFTSGMGAGGNMLLVPSGTTISAWVPKKQ